MAPPLITVRSGTSVVSFHDRQLAREWLQRNLAAPAACGNGKSAGFHDVIERINKLGDKLERITASLNQALSSRNREESSETLRNVCLYIEGLDKPNMPRSGDVTVSKDTTVGQTNELTAQI